MSNEQNTGRAEAFTATQVAKGSAWSIIGFGGAAIVRMGSSVVLTRVIPDAPSVYGVMALVFSFYGGILLFSDIGVPLLLTQNRRGMEPAFRNTAWTAQVVRGVALWLTALALAPLFASAYPDYPGLTELIAVTSLAAVIGGFDATALFAFRRNMETHKLVPLLESMTAAVMTAKPDDPAKFLEQKLRDHHFRGAPVLGYDEKDLDAVFHQFDIVRSGAITQEQCDKAIIAMTGHKAKPRTDPGAPVTKAEFMRLAREALDEYTA